MVDFIDAKNIIQDQFKIDWDDKTEVAYDNVAYTPDTTKSWVRLKVSHNISSQQTLGSVGNRVFRRQGFIFIQAFALTGKGNAPMDDLVNSIINIFEGKHIQGIWIQDITITEVGIDEVWDNTNVNVAFLYDQIK